MLAKGLEHPLFYRYQARARRNAAGRGAAQEVALPLSQQKAPLCGDNFSMALVLEQLPSPCKQIPPWHACMQVFHSSHHF